jgi:GT2 family glycosyltransferase
VITVVVPAWQAWSTLPAVMESLRPQVDRPDRELVLVESTAGSDPRALELRWPWARIISLPQRMLPGSARNLAVSQSRGELIAFTDADAVPEPDWLDELERALPPDADAVAGAILNGTPASVVGTTSYLLEFVEWHPKRRGRPRHGATCNLLIRRDVLDRIAGFPDGLWPGEDTVVTWPIAEHGRLAFAPGAQVRHVNRTRFLAFLRHQVRLGWSFAQVCQTVTTRDAAWGRLPRAPLSGVFRVPALWRDAKSLHALPGGRSMVWPLVCLGSCAWGVGLTAGAARGALRRPKGSTYSRGT